jgi:hypothetical protein
LIQSVAWVIHGIGHPLGNSRGFPNEGHQKKCKILLQLLEGAFDIFLSKVKIFLQSELIYF